MLVAGAWAPGEAPGGLLIFRVEDRAAVQAIVDADPFSTAGVVARAEVDYRVPILHREAAYDAWSWVSHVGTTSMVVESEICDGDAVLEGADRV